MRAWDAGHAVAPIDVRLAPQAQQECLHSIRPSVLVDADGTHELAGGLATNDGDAIVIQTSGTTSRPKAVVHTHSSIEASALATAETLQLDPRRHRLLACLPVARIGGLAVVMRALVTRSPLDTLESFDAKAVQNIFDSDPGTTITSLVPTAWRQLDTSTAARVVSGGMPPLGELPANVINAYGLTETGSGCIYDGAAIPGVEFRLDPNGRVELKGAVIARATRRIVDDEVVESAITDESGWFATNDVGQLVDGLLRIRGRADDVIVSGGENVWPDPIEAILSTHPLVSEVAVVGLPDEVWGQAVTAVVVPRDSKATPTLEELRAMVKSALPAWNAPHRLHVRPSLPRTVTGKVRRSEVAADVISLGQPER
jgi:O-succinylbenzoic acid--CoA ligase